MKYVSNGFSPKMLNPKKELTFTLDNSSYEEIQEEKEELVSSIGHTSISEHLNMRKNRMNIQLEAGDILYLVQLCHDEDNNEQFDYRRIMIGDE